jgi:putative MATE family efflux protein
MKLTGLVLLLIQPFFLWTKAGAFSCPSRYPLRVRLSSQESTNVGHSLGIHAKERRTSVLFQTIDIGEVDPQAPRNETTVSMAAPDVHNVELSRARQALPKNDELDRTIIGTAFPNMVNMLVVPLVNSVDTYWVGRIGSALALAGQAAANNAFMTIFYILNFLPIMTAPLVAEAVASGDNQKAQDRVVESVFLCTLFGGLGAIFLVGFPRTALSAILPQGAAVMDYAAPYLRWRALSIVPALLSSTGFAAYRGLLDTVTPLKVSFAANVLNLVLDPILVFNAGMGFVGAALATAVAEFMSGMVYMKLLLKRKLIVLRNILKPPSMEALVPLFEGASAMLLRQVAINLSYIAAARKAQAMDPTHGVAAAAYGIVFQLYSIGLVIHFAMQNTAATLVPSARAQSGIEAARRTADRTLVWGTIVGVILAAIQFFSLPALVPLFSTLPQVQQAAKTPAMIAALLHILNGPAFSGHGVMLGLGLYKDLALISAASTAALVVALMTPLLGTTLEGILLAQIFFCVTNAAGVLWHHFRIGPLAKRKRL